MTPGFSLEPRNPGTSEPRNQEAAGSLLLDVLIAGAGPAGSMAALVLARHGARVLIVDREIFPRDKLCGDTLNPGALALLASLGLSGGPLVTARPLAGMLLSGPRVSVR